MVHPWMTGIVNVHDSETVMEPEPIPEPEPEPIPSQTRTNILNQQQQLFPSTVLQLNETNECYIPYEVSISVGSTVAWSNDDSTLIRQWKCGWSTGVFDSGLFMAGGSFEHIPLAGTFDYFCMVNLG